MQRRYLYYLFPSVFTLIFVLLSPERLLTKENVSEPQIEAVTAYMFLYIPEDASSDSLIIPQLSMVGDSSTFNLFINQEVIKSRDMINKFNSFVYDIKESFELSDEDFSSFLRKHNILSK